ncbi:hypothetical protein KZP23_09495 [Echinicola marina]|uniref:hypothetical protein n=1 Tax=Echinicola marina TaxID=2859768 RepID=UPI001CF67FF5|nr:hypothetical protein [Echinicola marina]UCS95215.1 hypothetical protein KZP23_09495 [Echinicola marina]
MKKLSFLFITIGLITGCNTTTTPEKDTVLKIINEELHYPRIIDYEIFCSDPAYAKKLLDLELDKADMVTIQKTQKLKDIGSPLISFTETARPYLIETGDREKELDIQKVKIAEETISHIDLGSINETDGKTSIPITYTVTCTNITPFSVLMKRDFSKPKSHSATLVFINGKWRLTKP